MDQVYRQSALMRPKWDAKHRSDGATYGQMTIRKALENKPITDRSEHEGYLNFAYALRFNVVTNRPELKIDGRWELMDDYRFNSVLRDMRNKGANISSNRLQSLLYSDFVVMYHPFLAYFEGLPKWDGTDYIQELAEQVRTKDQEYWS